MCQLSWSYDLPQRVADQSSIASWVQRSPFILRIEPHPGTVEQVRRPATRGSWGVPVTGRLDRRKPSAARSARGVSPPTELNHQQATAISLQRCGASHEVWSPTAHSRRAGPLFPSLPLSVRSAFRVSTLLTACSRLFRPTVFQVGALMGLSPTELFPRAEAEAPLDARSPRDVHHPSPLRRRVDRAPLWSAATRHAVRPRLRR